ncbi:hypothetical protein IJT93_11515 [bacterium]|nr:hypothetical protein [bacterium]
MQIKYGKLAISLVLCSCLFGCSQQTLDALSDLGGDEDGEDVAVTEPADGGAEAGSANNMSGGQQAYVPENNGNMGGQAQQVSTQTASSQFTLIDQVTNLPVESYSLPAGWQGTGRVLRFSMKPITWQSVFVNRQTGSAAFNNFTMSAQGIGPVRNSPVLQNNALAFSLLKDLEPFLNMQNVQVTSSQLTPNDTPENRQVIQMMKQSSSPLIQLNCMPMKYHVTFSMTCNGQPYKAEVVCYLMCTERNAGRVMMHDVINQSSYGIVAPASLLQQESKSLQQILASCKKHDQFFQYGVQYNNQVNQQTADHMSNVNKIIQDKNNHINNIQNQINQSTAATQDRVRQGWHEVITEKTDVANPYDPSSTVQTDNNYNNAWVNSNGQVINTDSNLFNPNSDPNLNGTDWTQVK